MDAAGPNQSVGKIVDRDLATVARVENSGDAGRFHSEGQRADDVLHIDEIARLPAIAEDGDVLAAHGLFDENRHGGGVGALADPGAGRRR